MAELIDFTNKKIGHLTVICRSEQKPLNKTSAFWLCKCDCGKYCIKASYVLTKNKDASCGHVHKQKLGAKRRIDLTGMRFGKLLILQYAYSKNKRAVWKCQCDCGNVCFITGRYLKQGSTKSCGCYVAQCISKLKKKTIQSGSKFGKLTVIEQLKQRRNKSIYYRCVCQCGRELDVQAGHLVYGDTKSCGCVKSFPQLCIAQFLKANNIIFKRQFKLQNCKSRKGRKLPFDFAIFDNDNNFAFLIQFQGIQHFKNSFRSSKQSYNEYISHDFIKNNFCKQNNITIYYITYKDNIEQKLNQIFYKTNNIGKF